MDETKRIKIESALLNICIMHAQVAKNPVRFKEEIKFLVNNLNLTKEQIDVLLERLLGSFKE